MKVCLAPFRLLWTSYLGGQSWTYLNWAMGMQAAGCEVIILESFEEGTEPEYALNTLRKFKKNLLIIGVDFEIALQLSEEQNERFRDIREELEELTIPLESAFEQTELLINFRYGLATEIVSRFKRSALIDIDPGLFQLWVSEGQIKLITHDIYFTIGETVGQPEAKFPDLGLKWHYTPPAVFLPAWKPSKAEPSAPYTTISNWWSNWESYQGEVFNNEKRTSFLEYLKLPSRTTVPLELALCIKLDARNPDQRLLESNGWRVRSSLEVSSTPEQYRSYIRRSRGEFSCAKPSCMRFQNAWISDRTLCYLASGKPAVVQHTGPSRFLPDAQGLIRFSSLDEAVNGLSSIENNYEYHCRAAVELAREYFDAEKVAGRVLEKILEVKAKHN